MNKNYQFQKILLTTNCNFDRIHRTPDLDNGRTLHKNLSKNPKKRLESLPDKNSTRKFNISIEKL